MSNEAGNSSHQIRDRGKYCAWGTSPRASWFWLLFFCPNCQRIHFYIRDFIFNNLAVSSICCVTTAMAPGEGIFQTPTSEISRSGRPI